MIACEKITFSDAELADDHGSSLNYSDVTDISRLMVFFSFFKSNIIYKHK